ncbi:MAG: hypothetical protein KJ955_00205 [Nanoarchaeota archaeon]|nr:hypothetical protein [Nanoarchaeota archaeon]
MDNQFNKTDLAKKNKLEKRLCKKAGERTVTDVLMDIGSNTRVRIKPLAEMLHGIVNSGFADTIGCNILAGYKDGAALRFEREFLSAAGMTYYYFLHRNGENVVYALESQHVCFKRE